jgi:hypothetical protein
MKPASLLSLLEIVRLPNIKSKLTKAVRNTSRMCNFKVLPVYSRLLLILIEDIVYQYDNIAMREPLQFCFLMGPAQQADNRNPCSLVTNLQCGCSSQVP